MKLDLKRELIPLGVIAAVAAIAVYYYPQLPEVIPSHFNVHGDANGWMRKTTFFVVMGATFISIYLLFTFLPSIDPLRKKIEPRFRVVLFLRDILLALFGAIFMLTLAAAHSGVLQMNLFGLAFGALLVVLGNYMPKLPQNWFIGIRTPWTISSESVWRRTHILGGWLFAISGIIFIVCTLFKVNNLVPLVAIISAALISVLYSFYLFKREQSSGPGDKDNP
ncbi:MAG TPA: SdpI family protein [Candidatus Kryptonia bacterium]